MTIDAQAHRSRPDEVPEVVWSNLVGVYEPAAARAWLEGINPALGSRKPIDRIRAGQVEEVLRAIRAERADSFA